MNTAPSIQQLEMTEEEIEFAERIAKRLGFSQTAYTSSSALWGLFCLADNARMREGCIIKTKEFGFVFIQDLEDLKMHDLHEACTAKGRCNVITDFENDIPHNIAKAAHYGTSFSPEKRGNQERDGYAETLRADFAALSQFADTDEKKAQLDEEFARYREGYRKRSLALLHSKARCMSTMITGPANFPTARNNKRNDIAHKRLNELLDFRKLALDAIEKTLRPELRPIMAGDDDAVTRLQEKIAKAEADQAEMKAVNAAHKRFLKDPAALDAMDLSDKAKLLIRTYKPAYSWEPHPFPPYAMTNNNANIRRMKERLEQISKAKALPEVAREAESGIRLEDSPADNRVRLFFPGKPAEDIRGKLKSNGFRWAPSLGCWQAYRNSRSLAIAQEMCA